MLHISTINIALICVPLLINLAMLFLDMDKTLENDKNKFHKLVCITFGFGFAIHV